MLNGSIPIEWAVRVIYAKSADEASWSMEKNSNLYNGFQFNLSNREFFGFFIRKNYLQLLGNKQICSVAIATRLIKI